MDHNSEEQCPTRCTKILVAICSSHIHAERRAAVRATWFRRLPRNMKAQFFLGNGPLLEESDLIILDVGDSYWAKPTGGGRVGRNRPAAQAAGRLPPTLPPYEFLPYEFLTPYEFLHLGR